MTLGLDVGGTKVLAGIVGPAGELIDATGRPTPATDAAATRALIVDLVRELAAKHPVSAVGIGVSGLTDSSRSTVLFAAHLAWRAEPLRDYVEAQTGLPVVVENDANAAAWAEFRFGAGRHATASMVMFTVGTGIGGGFILGGELVRGSTGTAAEPGHMVVVPDGRPCGCGRSGCLDQYASGTALVRYAGVRSGTDVTTAAEAGEPAATRAFSLVAGWLASALADVVNLLDPQVIVIGGGVAEAGAVLLTPLQEAYDRALGERGGLPAAPLRLAELGNAAGAIGAGDLARRQAEACR